MNAQSVVASIDLRGTSATLLGCDVDLVNSRSAWFNDRVVAFYGAHFQTMWDAGTGSEQPCCNFVFGDPALLSFMCQYLDLSDSDECAGFLRGAFPELFPSAASSSPPLYLLLPVNPMYGTGAPPTSSLDQGSHWTLLSLLLSPSPVPSCQPLILDARHYDSMPSPSERNAKAARGLLTTFRRALSSSFPDGGGVGGSGSGSGGIGDDAPPRPSPLAFGHTPSVRQVDGSSCGLFAVLFGMGVQRAVKEKGGVVEGRALDEALDKMLSEDVVEEWRIILRTMVKEEVHKYGRRGA